MIFREEYKENGLDKKVNTRFFEKKGREEGMYACFYFPIAPRDSPYPEKYRIDEEELHF